MACDFCEQKGYVTSTFFANNASNISTRVCPKCNDIKAYSDYVMQKYGKQETQTHPQVKIVPTPEGQGEILNLTTQEGCKIYNLEAYRKILRSNKTPLKS